MTIIYYTRTEEGKLRALKKVNEYDAFEPLTCMGRMIERKTVVGLSNILSKHISGEFCLKEI